MTIIDRVKEALYEGSGNLDLAAKLTCDCTDYMHDQQITSQSEWQRQVTAINSQLRYWLLEKAKNKKDDRLNKKIHAARNSLSLPDRESYIEFWLADIRLDYAPVADSLF